MRIDRLVIENFKKFKRLEVEFPAQFTLLVGENGAGKTSILDALAVAAGIWLVDPPDSTLAGSRRNIYAHEIRIDEEVRGDRSQFREHRPVSVDAIGSIDGHPVSWRRTIRPGGKRTTNADAREALQLISALYARDAAKQQVLCPVIVYYGAGRAWLPSNRTQVHAGSNGPSRRWAAFYDCLFERIRAEQLTRWAQRETLARGRHGDWRPGFIAVRHAVLNCIPRARDLWFDPDLDQIVFAIDGSVQPFGNLSAGQRMMLAMVADLAIRVVTQNAFLLDQKIEGSPLRALTDTPGVVLIDELDVHLHPKWQRRVATDLKTVFPSIQFVCTSHSPQVISELKPEEIVLLEPEGIGRPPRSYGMDSSRVLTELMDSPDRPLPLIQLLERFSKTVDADQFHEARQVLAQLEARLGAKDPEVIRGHSLLSLLEDPA